MPRARIDQRPGPSAQPCWGSCHIGWPDSWRSHADLGSISFGFDKTVSGVYSYSVIVVSGQFVGIRRLSPMNTPSTPHDLPARLSRRQLLRAAAALGSASALGALLAACGATATSTAPPVPTATKAA